MRIQELRELSFKLSYLPLVYPTFFLCVFLSHPVAHQHHGGAQRHGLEQVVEEQGVHHGGLVHHQQAAGQRVVLVAGKAVP